MNVVTKLTEGLLVVAAMEVTLEVTAKKTKNSVECLPCIFIRMQIIDIEQAGNSHNNQQGQASKQ
jgi:hypothetical protein